MDISSKQCKSARILLEWDQQTLADNSKVGVSTIRDFEGKKRNPHVSTLTLLKHTFENAGIEFGVREMVRWKEDK